MAPLSLSLSLSLSLARSFCFLLLKRSDTRVAQVAVAAPVTYSNFPRVLSWCFFPARITFCNFPDGLLRIRISFPFFPSFCTFTPSAQESLSICFAMIMARGYMLAACSRLTLHQMRPFSNEVRFAFPLVPFFEPVELGFARSGSGLGPGPFFGGQNPSMRYHGLFGLWAFQDC